MKEITVTKMTNSKMFPVSCSTTEGCAELYTYCDTNTATCTPCATLCKESYHKCHEQCETFLKNALTKENIGNVDIHNLTVMVAMTAAMTGVVLVCLSVLVYFKLAKKRRRKKIVLPSVYSVEKEKCVLELSSSPARLEDGSVGLENRSDVLNVPARGLSTGISLQTVSTQLSQETNATRQYHAGNDSTRQDSTGNESTQQQYSTNDTRQFHRNSSNTTFRKNKRLPSEDSAPTSSKKLGELNQGLDSSLEGQVV